MDLPMSAARSKTFHPDAFETGLKTVFEEKQASDPTVRDFYAFSFGLMKANAESMLRDEWGRKHALKRFREIAAKGQAIINAQKVAA
jgi:hypothetical protein